MVALAAFAMILSACGGPAADQSTADTQAPVNSNETNSDYSKALSDKKITIAWIPKSLNNPVFEVGRAGAEKKAAELTAKGPYTVEIKYMAPVKADAAEQVQVMEDALSQGVEAMGVSCNLEDPCIDPIGKAVDAGVPVMTWDSDSAKSKRFTYLGVDNYEGGKVGGELMKELLPNGGKVAILSGVPGSPNLEKRIQGFKDAIQGSKIEVIEVVFCDEDISKSVTVVEEVMQKYPDLNGWFLAGAWNLLSKKGSMPLFEDAALNKGMQVVAFDTIPQFLPWVKEGYVKALIGQKYYGWGYDTVQMIYDLMVDGKSFESFTNSGMDIVTASNVDEMQNMWDTQDFTQPLPPYK
jgi:ribose transport system substrate-binding protein